MIAAADFKRWLHADEAIDEPGSRLRRAEPIMVFVLAAVTYLATAWYLNLFLHLKFVDAAAHVANAYYVFFSRDPHLAAIGFVWGPLPSISVMPLLPLAHLWAPLITQGFASALVSPLFMAGACYQLNRALCRLKLNVVVRSSFLLAFALHPLNLIAGGDGMTEAYGLFFALGAVRHLLRWIEDRSLGAQVMTGLFLVGAVLTRPEAPALAAGTAAVVGVISYLDEERGQDRHWIAASDVAIVVAPAALALGFWLLAAFILTGTVFPYQQWNTSSLPLVQGSSEWLRGGPGYRLHRMIDIVFFLEPMIAVTVIAGLLGLLRMPRQAIAVLGTVGALAAFVTLATLTNQISPFVRYYSTFIPLLVLIAALSVASWPRNLAGWRSLRVPMTTVLLAAQLLTLPLSAIAMSRGYLEPSVDRPGQVFGGPQPMPYANEGRVASYLDRLRLPDGSVLADSLDCWPVIIQSEHPKQFIISSDRDFSSTLRHPYRHRLLYFLVPGPARLAPLDSINRAYPTMYRNGAGRAVLVKAFPVDPLGAGWRLYRLQE